MKKKFLQFLQPRSARGQSLVELAISLVILLYILSGAAEFGIIFFQYVQLRDAAQEGALYGSLHPTSADVPNIIARTKASSDKPINLASGVTVEVFIEDDPSDTSDGIASTDTDAYDDKACEGHGIKVKLTYNHHVFMPFMPILIQRKDIEMHASVTDTILTPAPQTGAPSGFCRP